MTPLVHHNIFAQLATWQRDGLKTGLATLVDIDGSSPRPRGAQVGVAEDGRHVGSISSGCAEEAIIAETLKVLGEETDRTIRYGKNSPYLDITLPCGSGLDILFTGCGLEELTAAVGNLHAARQAAYVTSDGSHKLSVSKKFSRDALIYPPDYRLHVFGAGEPLVTFTRLAALMGYVSMQIYTTDDAARDRLKSDGIEAHAMTHQTRFEPDAFDEFSAVITLFHEHNLEIPILEAALHSQVHFIGALGSRNTHAQRRSLMDVRPPTPRPFSDIVGPAGLNIGAADPAEIALSIMAQIVEQRRRAQK